MHTLPLFTLGEQASQLTMRRYCAGHTRRTQCVTGVLLLGAFLLSSCGGGSGSSSGGGGNPPPAPDFSLSVPANVSVQQETSTTITVGVTGLHGFNSEVSVTISGMPAGVTVTPGQFNLGAGDQEQVVIAASSSAAAASTNLAVSATSGSLQHSGKIDVTVSASQSPPPSSTRIRYDRTDVQWDATFFNFFPQPLILYDPPTKRFFLSDTSLNRVEVFDATTEALIGVIPVPGAFSGDESPDHKTVYIGTQIGDLYEIDPVAMKLKMRIPAVEIGPSGFATYEVRALADGRLALLSGQGGIPAVDGYSSIGIWNPGNNSLAIAGSAGVQSGCALQDHIVEFALTADRTKILVGSGVSGGTLCMYDPNTGAQTVAETNPQGIGIGQILVPPDGQEILVASGSQVTVYATPDLVQTDVFQVGSAGGFYRFALSKDGNTIFALPTGNGDGIAFDWRTKEQLGWIQSFNMYDTPGTMVPLPMVADETKLIASAIGHGVVFLDGATLQAQPPGNVFSFEYSNVVQPTFGPVQGGAQAVITSVPISDVDSVDFGTHPASIVSTGSSGITVTTPAGSAGPVDVSMNAADGSFLLLPEDYSYGPSIIEVTTSASTAEGGGTGTVLGYGFGSADSNGQAPGLQISVGGHPATITQYLPQPFSQSTPYYPFPIEAVQYTMPAGNAGLSADLAITNSAGSATASSAIQYFPAIQQYPLAGAVLVQGIYDPKRDLYYFTDQTQIRVFSRTQGAWLASIPAPANAQRLWGISLSPDGSKLAVSDAGTNRIYVLNPDSPSAVSSFPLLNTGVDQGEEPGGLAIADSGIVYFSTFYLDFTGGWAIHKLDTKTGTVTDYQSVQDGALGADAYTRVLLSKDNSRVYVNVAGGVFSLDTATDTVFFNPILVGFNYELALSSNQTWMSATEYLMDTNLNLESIVTYVDREVWNQSAVYGEKISADGNLLFAPLLNGLDVIDGRGGGLRTRIALPLTLSANYDALVDDGKDNVLVAITGQSGSGIAVIDLTSLPEPLLSASAVTSRSSLIPVARKTSDLNVRMPDVSTGKPATKDLTQTLARPQHLLMSPVINSAAR